MQGRLIVLEGIDGSGKSTQYSMLCSRLTDEGRQFRHIIFPRYDKQSSALLRMYLGGEFGSNPSDVNPYASSTFYAVDRYASYKTDWGEYYRAGGTVLSDRYTTSNAVHQGSKLEGAARDDFFDWLYDFEYRLLELPRPELVIYLDIDVETSLEHMHSRQTATQTRGDIHETDAEYLKKCLNAGNAACSHYGWRKISCISPSGMRPAEDIHQQIYDEVRGVL